MHAWLAMVLAANPYLDKGRQLYGALQFKEALAQLAVARDVPTNDPQEKVEILDLLARCEVAEGQRDAAGRHYEELLTLAPHAELPREVSPKILEVFDEAKHRLFEPDYAAFRPLSAAPGLFRAEVVDPWNQVTQVAWFHRSAQASSWVQSVLTVQGHDVAVPLAAQGESWLAWYAEARRADGVVLARHGSALEPQIYSELAPGPPGSGAAVEPVRGRRVAGIVLAGVGVLAAVAGVLLEGQSQQDAAFARTQPWADQAIAQHARALTEARAGIGLFAGAGALGVGGATLFVW